MGNGIATVEVKVMRGKLTVIALGRTPKGRKYIKDTLPLTIKDSKDKKAKGEIAAAMDKLYESD